LRLRLSMRGKSKSAKTRTESFAKGEKMIIAIEDSARAGKEVS
jgi:hypothetical protein